MSLDYSLENISNHETLCFDAEGDMTAVTRFIIFNTMVVGMGDITQDNFREFWLRCEVVDKMDGIYLNDSDTGRSVITLDVIEQHIGLWTNASRLKTGEWFENRVAFNLRNMGAYEAAE
ncbi:MAG: hypothetical protein ACR2OK_01905 [Parvibaculales bacterium]